MVIKTFETEVLSEKIVKDQTIVKAKKLLEGVVQNGSGKNLNISAFKVGGKTGTAVIAKQGRFGKGKTAYGEAGNRIYQASFVGYFPADNPLYSCIVVINSPSNGVYYGAAVAGPVFKEIAEKVYSGSLNCIEPVNAKKTILTQYPAVGRIQKEELDYVSNYFGMVPAQVQSASDKETELPLVQATDRISSQLKKGLMPDLMGLSAKDALFLLENNGVEVKLLGMGTVKKQSIQAGQKFEKGNSITLTLG
jgi:cell division protein FtsI (penicillin-binding protein 3)